MAVPTKTLNLHHYNWMAATNPTTYSMKMGGTPSMSDMALQIPLERITSFESNCYSDKIVTNNAH
jgi:hypothetical protein